MRSKAGVGVLTAVIVLLGAGFYVRAQTPEPMRLAYWSPPATGEPVVEYVLERSLDGGEFEMVAVVSDTFARAPVEIGTAVYRVAGRDRYGRQGIWSPESEPVHDDGPPGAPGKIYQTVAVQ